MLVKLIDAALYVNIQVNVHDTIIPYVYIGPMIGIVRDMFMMGEVVGGVKHSSSNFSLKFSPHFDKIRS